MYFEARSPDQPTVILSAVSDDALAFAVEPGIRVGDGRWSYGTPRCLYIEPAGQVRVGPAVPALLPQVHVPAGERT